VVTPGKQTNNGSILEHYIQQSTTVSAAWYSEILKSKLKPAIRNKCGGFIYKGVLLLPKIALPHTAAGTVEAIRQPKFELLLTPPTHTHM
jgi:hypothetical protein